MKSMFLRLRSVLSLFVFCAFVSVFALAFGYKVVASRLKPTAPRAAAPVAKAPQARTAAPRKSQPEDDPAAQEFFRFKRLPAGETLLSEERYAPARQQTRALSQTATETKNRRLWQQFSSAENATNPLASAKFYTGALAADGNFFIGGTANQGVLRGSINEGNAAWEQLQPSLGSAVAVDQHDAKVIFLSRPGALYRSTDAGHSFTNISSGLQDSGLFVTPFVVDALTSQRIWLGGTAVWRTQDGGTTWQQASPTFADKGKVSALSYATANHNFVLAGTTTGTIYRSYNGLASTANQEWQSATPRAGYVSALVVEPQNPNVVYATYATFGGAHVWRSEDAGVTWQSLAGKGATALPDVPVHALVIDPRNSQRLFIGTDLGLFTTTDGGKTWASEAPELGSAIVESLALQTTNDEVNLFAFTYGNGVWESDLTLALECTYSISVSNQPSATGGQFSVFVSTASECGWTATSNANWITITSATAGKGSATISYTVPPHYELAARTGTLTVGGQTVTVTQTGLTTGCEVNPIKVGETVAGMIKAGSCIPIGYGSTTSYNATYFTFTANRGDQIALSFQGEFEPQLRMWAPNGTSNTYTSSSRTMRAPTTGFITIASSGTHLVEISNYFSARGNFTLSLVAPTAPSTCGAFSLSTNVQAFEATGGSATVEVSGGATCPWAVKSNVTWITTPTTAGTGDATVSLIVAANTTTVTRTGSIEIAGQTVTITQAGSNGTCAATPINIGQTINGVLNTGDCNSRYNFDGYPARAADLYTFTATEGQQVMIAATAPTLTVQLNLADQYGAPLTPYGFRTPLGTGYVTIPATGTYTLEVTTNYFNSSSRTGNYALSLLSPASGCGYVLPTIIGIKGYEAEGGPGTVGVTSGNGCGWVATTHYDWIKINTPTGISSGNVEFTLTPNNTGRSRIGAMLISGQSFLLEQAATGGTCLSSPITPGQPVKGSLDVTDCLSTYDVDAYATDRYSFNATVGQQLRVDVNPTTTAGVRVYLLDANNRLLQRSTGSFPTGNGFFTVPATGRYNLEIATTAFSGSVPYTATMSLVAAGCSYTATAVSNYFEALGGEGSIDLTAGNDCLWDVSTAAPWLTLAATSGSGTGHVNFTVAPNTSTASRSGLINIGGQVLTINQAGTGGTCGEQPLIAGQTVNGRLTNSDCRGHLSGPTSFPLYADRYSFSGLEGQQIFLGLRAAISTPTMYLTDATGKIITSHFRQIPSTSGYFRLPATGVYFVEVVSSSQQDYALNFVLVPGGCSIAIAPAIATVEPTGGNGNFKIIAGQNCPWSMADLPAWVTLSGSPGGSGSSTVNFTAAPNTTTARRRATLLIGGQSFAIEQPGVGGTCGTLPLTAGQTVKGTLGGADCLSNLLETIPTIKDRYTFTGLAGNQIALTAAADTSFPTMTITVLDPTGAVYVRNNQRVPNVGFVTLPTDGTYTVEVTSSSASSTTNVNYSLILEAVAPQCNFTVTPTNNLFEAAGGTGSLAVQVPDTTGGCSWSVAALPSWITSSDGASGTGSGTVNFKVAENTATGAREVTLIVAGNPVRIEQAGKSGSCGTTPLAFGQTVNGTNSSADCRSRFRTSTSSGSYYARQFAFAFTAGQQLVLTAVNTSSLSFTPYLYIYDDKGVIVAQGETRLPAGTGFLSLPATARSAQPGVILAAHGTDCRSSYGPRAGPPLVCA